MRGMQITVPLSLPERVLELAHEGHQGIVKTHHGIPETLQTDNGSKMYPTRCQTNLVSYESHFSLKLKVISKLIPKQNLAP